MFRLIINSHKVINYLMLEVSHFIKSSIQILDAAIDIRAKAKYLYFIIA